MSYPGAVLIAGLVLLWLGAEGVIRGGRRISSLAGISPLIVGLTFGAIATSLPEITVSWIASFTGAGAVSLGNAAGSNIANTGLALGLGALIYPLAVEKEIMKYDLKYLIAAALFLYFCTIDMRISRPEGILLIAGFFVYALHIIKRHRGSRRIKEASSPGAVKMPALFFAAGVAGLLAGGHMAVAGALALAETLSISQAAVGLSIVAVGTSLPEIAVVVAGGIRKSPEISFGTVIGSNILNIFLVAGGAALINPITIEKTEFIYLAPAVVLFTALLFPVMFSGRKLSRLEGLFLLLCYAGYIVLLAIKP